MRHYRVTLGDVLQAHAEALKFGGRDGIVSKPSILSAIGRPYSGYYRPIYRKAAALTESLARNHGFVDGNKRTALLTLTLFLDRSGYGFAGARGELNEELEELIVDIALGTRSFDACVDWFQRKLMRL